MILNKSQREVAEKIRYESEANPVARAVFASAETSTDPFEVEPGASGLEIHALVALEHGLSNRARMKVFSPKARHTIVFFYKRSLVPYSRDRYSYGGIELKAPQAEDSEIADWLTFLSSGFRPEKRPANLRRTFLLEIPE